MRRTGTLLISMLLIVTACGDDDATPDTSASTAAPPATAAPSPTAATTPPAAPAADTAIAAFIAGFGEPGDCIDVEYSGLEFDYEAGAESVSCDGPHDLEVFYVGELPFAADEPWPGEEAVQIAVFDDVCRGEFDPIYGPLSDTPSMTIWATYPLEEEWDAGLRTFKCAAASWFNDEDGTQFLGSAASGTLTPMDALLAVVAEYDGRDVYTYPFGPSGDRLAERNLTDDGNAGVEDTGIPGWSPDGSMLAIAALDDAEQWNIFVVDVPTGIKTQLTFEASVDTGPRFSPDGSSIVFTGRDRNQAERDVYVMDADGSNVVQLTDDPATDSTADWSPDGSQIVFRSNRSGSNDIWIMNADGSDQRLLVDLGGDEYDPRWSPDGGSIVFISNVSGNFDIWVAGADGSDPVNLTDHPADDEYPSWSPDGAHIVFNSSRRGVVGLWIMNADGSDQSDLLRTGPVGWGSFAP